MKKLNLKFAAQKMTKEQMKNVKGGERAVVCTWTWSGGDGCASGTDDVPCSISNDPDVCQQGADNNCLTNDCCNDVDCH